MDKLVQECKSLDELWSVLFKINATLPDTGLAPILGGGEEHKPKFMFVFINPTAANASASMDWVGPRFPFIGTKQIWRIFHRAQMFDDGLMMQIENQEGWSFAFTHEVLLFLKRNSFYFTNLVKRTGSDATLPSAKEVGLFLPLLQKEIELVKPHHVITFGAMSFEALTGKKIKLGDYYGESIKGGKLKEFKTLFWNFEAKIIPCYFPVGRGNPKRAVELLKLVKKL